MLCLIQPTPVCLLHGCLLLCTLVTCTNLSCSRRALCYPQLPANANFANVIGYVKLHITEAALSLTRIDEINPIDLYALVGNVGGLWGKQDA